MRFKTSITSGANLRNGSFRCSFLALHLVCGNMLQWLAAGSLHRAFQLLRVLLDEQRAECCHTEIDFDVAFFNLCSVRHILEPQRIQERELLMGTGAR